MDGGPGDGVLGMKWRAFRVGVFAFALLGAGPPAPILLRALDGAEIQITHGPGEPDVVLHFWASWCRECGEELPSLADAAQACAPERVRVVAVNIGEEPEVVRAHLAQHPFDLPVLLDPGGRAWRRAGMFGVPANLVWTQEGMSTSIGPTSAQAWRERLAALGCRAASREASPIAGP